MHTITEDWLMDNQKNGTWTDRQIELLGTIRGFVTTTIGRRIHDITKARFEAESSDDPEPAPAPLTMRQLLDTLHQATEAERQEFSQWWSSLPIPTKNPADYYDLSQL